MVSDTENNRNQIDLSLIIPTYNESDNILHLVDKLSFSLESVISGKYELIIVDDNSPDRTWQIAQSLTAQYPSLRVIRRTADRGLSSAVICGWEEAAGEILGVMDGDLQHPPATLLQMLDEIKKGADLVVASRHITGGGISDWHIGRRFLSRGAQLLGLLILPEILTQVSDPMSGYFLVRRAAIANKTLNPIGYKILLEVLAKGEISEIAEAGYIFQERLEGETKVTSKHYFDYLHHLVRLRINLFGRLLKWSSIDDKEEEPWLQPPIRFKIFVIILIALGTFFRFTHLDQKAFCGDEPWTALAISGHTVAEVRQEINDHRNPFSISALDTYQHLNPDRGVGSTINYLVTSDPQHPPLYYAIVRLWAQLLGDSPAALRSLSALISLFLLPSVYWICLELFESSTVGWISMALVAVSPLQIFFAQESRQYSLWMVTILVSTAAFLRASRRQTASSWGIYCLSTVLGLYTHLLTGLVLMAHGAYALMRYGLHHRKIVCSYLLSTLISSCLFLPWAIILVRHISTAINLTSGWGKKLIDSPLDLIAIYFARLSRPLFDLNLTSDIHLFDSFKLEGPAYYSLFSLVLGLIILTSSGYFLVCKLSSKPTHLLIILIAIFSGISLLVWDLGYGGVRSIQIRYQLPFYLFEELTLAYILGLGIAQSQLWKRKFWQSVLLLTITFGLISDIKFLHDGHWWSRSENQFTTRVAQVIQQSETLEKSLIFVDESPVRLGDLLYLSRTLSQTYLLSAANNVAITIPMEYDKVFFLEKKTIRSFQVLEKNDSYVLDELIKPQKTSPKGLWQFTRIKVS
ncbi:glycosyltransferase [Leptolyngbya cf. ectocarpi LEGE 11479]|uniref:Dolichol-phosphate mannosyltransferase n=1 Tax=Leptolyngbya cf. ectocarpi LEGE 11479 TaxID=1828722 RepID=A0A928ZYU9_LEPEC|nr:glycosyltransferase [Leptolyngbya ectocarpi]MBE9069956.1 glycosyltransferase [Leptolyngbya cf. ectocarpi LEGE 11479]